ncbi:MAG TPA: TolC family protein [Terriglobales bacterium]|nr:TolC family protein [Terriglobales bacterium]
MIRKTRLLFFFLSFSRWVIFPALALLQAASPLQAQQAYPPAPSAAVVQPKFETPAVAGVALAASFPPQNTPQTPATADAQSSQTNQPSAGVMRLTRTQAEQLAIKNNPRVSVGRLLALAEHQVYRETRSAALPNFNGAVTAVDAEEGSRIGAGALTASRVLEHAGTGVTLSQLITDFGRTANLMSASKLREKAQNANALATTEDIVLATDQAFYNALQAQALLKVAQQTVTTRQSVEHQVDELTKNKLKSTLDLAFAQVNLSQAKLLQLDAQNNVDATIAALTAVLGFDKQIQYQLVEENEELPAPPPDVDVLTDLALKQRPDLQALSYNQQAAHKFQRAQHDQLYPTIGALGIAGYTPVRPDCTDGCFPNYFISSWYGAVGVNMSVPIFNGFLFTAESSEANYRAKAAAETTRDLRDAVVRDVRTAWLSAGTAFQRVGVAAELAKEADLGLNLAQSRYQLGLGSIVELSQAQLQQADAAIGYVNAQYQYRLTLSTLNFEIGAQP